MTKASAKFRKLSDPHEAFIQGGALDRPVQSDRWDRPGQLHLRDGLLIWSGREKAPSPNRTVFESFLKLANATDRAILTFAKKWGVLYLCQHRLPSSHATLPPYEGPHRLIPTRQPNVFLDADVLDLIPSGGFARCPLIAGDANTFVEHLDDWRRYARQAANTVQLALQVHRQNLGEPKLWGELCGPAEWLDPEQHTVTQIKEWQPDNLSDARFRLSQVVNRWLDVSAMQPMLCWGSYAQPTVTLGNRTLFGYLASQLLLVVSKTRGLALCTECAEWFTPTRQLPPGRNPYCAKCGRAAAIRDASRRYRAKHAARR